MRTAPGITHENASLREALAEHEGKEVDEAAIAGAKARAAELEESLRTYAELETELTEHQTREKV